MQRCEIYPVPFNKSFRWKWRIHLPNGRVVESEGKYALYYECVEAARASGHQPELKGLARGERELSQT